MSMVRDDPSSIAARAKRRFPQHRVDVAYAACLPVYELFLKVTEMAEGELSTTARFVLQLSSLEVGRTEEIERLLGLGAEHVVGAAAELLGGGLVSQGLDQKMEVTEQGRQVLSDGGRLWRPRNRHPRVPFDPVGKRVVYVDTERLLGRDEVRKRGLFVLPVSPRRPRLGSIRLEEVADYERNFGRRRTSGEMLEVAAIRDIRLKYRDDIVVVKLDPEGPGASAFVVYCGNQYAEQESIAVQRLVERGVEVVPGELKRGQSMVWAGWGAVSGGESEVLATIEDLDRKILENEQARSETEVRRGDTQDAAERAELASRIEVLESERAGLKRRLEASGRKLEELTKGKTKLVKTEEHRGLLLRAVNEAAKQLTLVSAWIDPYAFDEEVRRGLVGAMERGADVRIAWGLGTGRRGAEGERNREKGENVIKQLRRMIPTKLRSKLEVRRTETHEKFIICDNIFCAGGSFNWLSYKGDRDSAYRRETSYYSEKEVDVELWRERAESLFG